MHFANAVAMAAESMADAGRGTDGWLAIVVDGPIRHDRRRTQRR
ncbi:hypothetical protein [Mycobacterium sp. 852002-50816_SCH5313054-b]|nr:hypothetical protein [Mycobacterium sp. 852002-50816_SCH5313054-b]